MDDPTGYDRHLAGFAPFRGLERPARVFIALVCALAAADVAMIVTNVLVADFLTSLPTSGGGDADALDGALFWVSVARAVLFVAAAVAYIVWFHRAYTNLPRLGVPDPRHHAGWAIASWFVPVVSLFLPKRMHNDIWRASEPSLPWPARRELWDGTSLPDVHGAWWFTFIASAVLERFAGGDPSGGSPWLWAAWSSTPAVVELIAVVLVVQIVRAVTARQRARAVAAPWVATWSSAGA
jgi:hypothetical protein